MSDLHALNVAMRCEDCAPEWKCDREGERHHFEVAVECPGVTDSCRMWWECGRCSDLDLDAVFAIEEDGEAHGQRHQRIDGVLMTPTDTCYVQVADSLADALEELDLTPGRHVVDHDWEDGLYLRLVPINFPAPPPPPPPPPDRPVQETKEHSA